MTFQCITKQAHTNMWSTLVLTSAEQPTNKTGTWDEKQTKQKQSNCWFCMLISLNTKLFSKCMQNLSICTTSILWNHVEIFSENWSQYCTDGNIIHDLKKTLLVCVIFICKWIVRYLRKVLGHCCTVKHRNNFHSLLGKLESFCTKELIMT